MDAASTNKTTYNGADLYQNADAPNGAAVAITDKVMLGGTLDAVKAAVDTNGKGSLRRQRRRQGRARDRRPRLRRADR